jgi:hypothetical protein
METANMASKAFIREQAEKFRDYESKFPDRDLLSLFDEWADSKYFSDKDREEILKEVIAILPTRKQILRPNLKVHTSDNPALLKDIVKVVLYAIELSEKNEGRG